MDDRARRTRPGRQVMRALVAAPLALALVLATMAPSHPAGAGGADWLYPARDRYEPGQTVTMIGYGGIGRADWRETGPFYAYLRVDAAAAEADSAPGPPATAPVAPSTAAAPAAPDVGSEESPAAHDATPSAAMAARSRGGS
jgi:hypothetical protein